MLIDSSASLIETLRRLQLLEPVQLGEVARLVPTFPDARALAKELLQRAWLTPYQVNQLLQGRGGDLVLGQYVIQERLGEGGMGQVFKAQQRRLNRVVALKVIRKDRLANPEAVRRFHREVQAVAQLSHPNVVVAYDADQVCNTHFFAMEYVEGTDLARLVRESGPLPAVFACDYIRQAALGLQHAHERGLVHRDIKPSNLLVAWAASRRSKVPAGAAPARAAGEGTTGRPIVKILDMGLARLDSADDDDSTSQLTQEGSVMGTLDYLAPEQAQNSRLADIRSDLYSLGCTFYFILTGQVPFPGGTATEKLLRHRLDDPPSVDKLRPDVPAGVAAVIRKLLAKKPEDRFQTPAELEAALAVPLNGIGAGIAAAVKGGGQRALGADQRINTATSAPVAVLVTDQVGTPVALALPITANGEETLTSGRFHRLVKKPWPRWQWLAAGAGLGLALLVLLLVVRSGFRKGRPAPPLPSVEQTSEADLKRLKGRLEDYAADPEPARRYLLDVRRVHAATPQAVLAAELLGHLPSPLDQLDTRNVSAADRVAAGQLDGLVAVIGDQRLRHWGRVRGIALSGDGLMAASIGEDSIIRLWDTTTGHQLRHIAAPQFNWVTFMQGGKRLATTDGASNLKTWDPSSGRELAVPQGRYVGSTSDQETVALTPGNNWAVVKLVQLATGKERLTFSNHTGYVQSVAFTPDGQLAVSASNDQTVLVWDTATGNVRTTFKGHGSAVYGASLVADGKLVLSYEHNTVVKLWELATGKEVTTFKGYSILGVAPHGKAFALRAPDNSVKVFEGETGKEKSTLRHEGFIGCLAFSPDGHTVATGSMISADSLKFWDLTSGAERAPPRGAAGSVIALAFAADGKTLVTSTMEGAIRVWNTGTASDRLPAQSPGYSSVTFSPDCKTLALTSGGVVQLWDPITGKQRAALTGHQGAIGPVVFSPDGLTLATGSRDNFGVVKLWDVGSGQVQWTQRHTQYAISSLSFLPDGKSLASSEWYTAKVWDVVSGQQQASFDGSKNGISYCATAADGKTLTVANLDGTLNVWDLTTKKPVRALSGVIKGPAWPAYSPDGRLLAVRGGQDGVIKVWDAATYKELATLPASIAWEICPDSRSIAMSSGDAGQLQIWDPATGQMKLPLEGHSKRIESLSYAPDGQTLASASVDGRVIVWEPGARKRKIREWQLPGQVQRVIFAPDGRHIGVVNVNGTIYILRLGPPSVKAP